MAESSDILVSGLAGGGGGIAELVEDLTPQLGGNLDLNGNVITGMVIGTNVQAYDAQLADVAGLTPTDNGVIIGNGTNFVVESGATLKTSLGLTIGTDVQAYDAQLADIAGLTPTDNGVIIGDGVNFVVESGATLKTSLGLTIGTDVQAYDADLTTLATSFTSASASTAASLALHEDTDNGTNKVTIIAPASVASDKTATLQDVTGTLYISGGDDVIVADGGTGLSSTTAYAVLCGGTTSTAALQSIASVGTSGQILTSNGVGALPTFQTVSAGEWTTLRTITLAADASVNLSHGVSGVDFSYDEVRVVFHDVVGGTDSDALRFKGSTDGGSTYVTAEASLNFSSSGDGGTYVGEQSTGTTVPRISSAQGNVGGESYSGIVLLPQLQSAVFKKAIVMGGCENADGNAKMSVGIISYPTTSAINYIQIIFQTGTLATGTIVVEGRNL